MVLLTNLIWNFALIGTKEDGRKVRITSVPKSEVKSFFSYNYGSDWKQQRGRDIADALKKLEETAREDSKNYYMIPKEPQKTGLAQIIWAYDTFKI